MKRTTRTLPSVRPLRHRPRGSAIVIVLIFSSLLAIVTIGMLSLAIDRRRETARMMLYNMELAAAESLLQRAASITRFIGDARPDQIRNVENPIDEILDILSANYAIYSDEPLDGFRYEFLTEAILQDSVEITQAIVNTIDPQLQEWIGYELNLDSYRISVGASATNESNLPMSGMLARPGVYVSQVASYYDVPLLKYAIFYENLFELDGGARIDVRGKVHTNEDWYLTSSSSVGYHDTATVAGSFYGGIYNPLDGSRRRWWSGSQNIEITNAAPDGAGGSSDSWGRVFQGASEIGFNKGWLSSAIYNPGNLNGNPVFNSSEWGSSSSGFDPVAAGFWNANPDWQDMATNIFNGYLRDKSHGVERVRLPIGEQESPRLLIEAPDLANDINFPNKLKVNLAYQASIIIEPTDARWINPDEDEGERLTDFLTAYRLVPQDDGTYEKEFFPLVAQDPDDPDREITFVEHIALFNGREEEYVHLIDIDMEKLAEYLAATQDAEGNPTFSLTNPYDGPDGKPIDDGIIYVNTRQDLVPSGTHMGARFLNMQDLSDVVFYSQIDEFKGLTMATNGPIYTKGHVNKDNKIPLMIAGDAVNILSRNFNDSDYSKSGLSGNGPRKNAGDTETNAVFITGNVPTKLNQYGGGGENFFRYLENWGGRTHKYRGSMLNLFESQVATTSWDKNTGTGVSSGYYGPPRRDWGWDTDFAQGIAPPGIPTAKRFALGRWSMVNEDVFVDRGGTSVRVY